MTRLLGPSIVAAVVTAAASALAAVRLSGEAMVGVGLDYAGFGDYDHYLVVEPAAAVDGNYHGFSFGLRGSLIVDTLRFQNDAFAWDVAGRRPGVGVYLAAPLGYENRRLRIRIGPWLHTDDRGEFGRRTSLFAWGAGDLRIRFQRVHLLLESFSHLPVATSGSGLHLGVHLPDGYAGATAATWTVYLSSPMLVGVSSRHVLSTSVSPRPLLLQASAGFDLFQGWQDSQGPAFELGFAVGFLFQP
jgi:hypothetical protein